jgi:hypothetical protein
MKNKNKDAFWKKERGMALNIGGLAEVSGYSRGEISRQISPPADRWEAVVVRVYSLAHERAGAAS